MRGIGVGEGRTRVRKHSRAAWSVNVPVIERERILRGWTQRQLARNARVDQGTLTDLLERRRQPTFGTMQAICATLNLSLADAIVFDANLSQGAD